MTSLKLVFRRLIPYAWRYRWRLIATVLLAAAAAAGQKILVLLADPVLRLIFPAAGPTSPPLAGNESSWFSWLQDIGQALRNWFHQLVFGQDRSGDPLDLLWRVAWIVVLIALATAIIQYCYVVLARNMGLRMLVDLRRDVCENLLRLSMKYHGEKKMGDLLTRLTADVHTAQRAVTIFFEDIIQSPFMLIGALFTAFYGSPQLTVAVLLLIPIVAFPIAFFARKVRSGSYQSANAFGSATATMEQMLSGIRVVKAFQMEKKEIEGLDEANRLYVRKAMKMVRAKAATEGFLILLTLGGTGLVLYGIGWMELNNHLFGSMQNAIVFLGAIAMMYAHVKQSTKLWYTMLEASGSGVRLFQILDMQPEVVTSKDAVAIEKVEKQIEFRNLSFAYDQDPVLKNLNFSAKVGTRNALVGPSGAGKTTTLDLLARFYDPNLGSILVDGRDLKDIKLESWLKQIAIVSQQPFVFNTSIRENIRYGRPTASDEEVEEAAKAANVEDFAKKLPEGYDTIVGERGTKLSGGELQRITIARAILKNASVLLLDEATSSLDSASEKAVQAALDNLMKGRTTFVIAHRLSTVRHADQILVLERGQIVEKGSHAQLLEKNGLYRKLYEIQFASTD